MHGGRETSEKNDGDQDRCRCNTVVAAAGVPHFDLTVSAAFLQPVRLAGDLVNNRKFSAGTPFFSHTKLASSIFSRSNNDEAQPNEQVVYCEG